MSGREAECCVELVFNCISYMYKRFGMFLEDDLPLPLEQVFGLVVGCDEVVQVYVELTAPQTYLALLRSRDQRPAPDQPAPQASVRCREPS